MARGSISHIEFPADDVERAKKFYAAIAGWEFSDYGGGYWVFRTEEGHGGGLGKRGESVGSVVRVYINVENLEEAVAAAEANGGTVVTPPSDIPGQGRFAAVTDTEGSEIGLYEVKPG
jgi:uncharacterized protein